MENRNESMCHIGMNRESIREAVISKLAIGKQYRLKSTHASQKEDGKIVKCKLAEFSLNVAVFIHKNGTAESFTYQDLWIQMMEGAFA